MQGAGDKISNKSRDEKIMSLLGFFPWKAKLILLEDILRTTREAKCYNKECPFDRATCDYTQMDECYKPRIKVGDIVKLYTGLYHRDYCKILDIDISPETNVGPGPIDFKFSRGFWIKLHL
ncbi:hypothetical protein LCGC14_2293050, partial [marine sediment metagenome]